VRPGPDTGETPLATTTDSAIQTYKIDKSHSEAVFQVRHLVTKVRGRFDDFEGTVQINDERPDLSSVNFVINATSIDTNEKDRDTHLRSADFFDVEKFPQITFKSTRVAKKSDESYDVAGNLTIHGVTKEISLPVTHLGKAKDPWGNERVGFESEITLNRKDYGLMWNAPLEVGGFLVGDDVRVSLSIQAVAQ
jgi:polyisoprenoid-binding protein YceI